MPVYVSLINLTDQGIRTIKDDPNRVKSASRIADQEGIKLLAEWWTMGPYDAVMITEAPDDETINRFLLGAGRQGNIRTVTLRAFTPDEMAQIIERLE
ncbi:MAG: GYD domain-containing protein [Chloroflexi bacterium]|nr:GYD domain-containing protein [Chloroflexota bacterium]